MTATLLLVAVVNPGPLQSRRRLILACLSLSCALPVPITARAIAPLSGLDKNRKRVFAHYMVAWPRGGRQASIESYRSEMRDAHARGIDGFALNCGGWHRSEPQYKQRVMSMYEAAGSLDFDFTLFVSADGHAQDEIDDIVESTRGLKAQLRMDGKPVLSAYAAGGKGFSNGAALIDHARRLGAFFVPHFFPETGERLITPVAADQIVQRLGTADGYFYFGAAGLPELIADSVESLGPELRAHGKLFMAPVTPYYRGLPAGTNYRAFETEGFSGMAAEWEAAIASNASWVQIVTWNDWAESTYVAPLPMPAGAAGRAHVYDDRFGELPSHAAYLDASAYYIQWFKTGNQPAILRDQLFYFYRLNPPASAAGTPPQSQTPLSTRIHVSVFLTAPATLIVQLPGADSDRQIDVHVGITHLSVDSRAGRPRFVLKRQGKRIIDKSGEQPITDDDFSGAYNYFSGSAQA